MAEGCEGKSQLNDGGGISTPLRFLLVLKLPKIFLINKMKRHSCFCRLKKARAQTVSTTRHVAVVLESSASTFFAPHR